MIELWWRFRGTGADGVQVGYYCETDSETESPSSTTLKPAVRIMFQVTQIVRFLLERGLRFRNLGFCGHDLM